MAENKIQLIRNLKTGIVETREKEYKNGEILYSMGDAVLRGESTEGLLEATKKLHAYLRELGSVAVAFSAGVDSTFLLKTAFDVLGKENVAAVTVRVNSFPDRELKEAREFCERNGITQIICEMDELSIPGFADNPPDRCYICKKEIFKNICKLANEYGYKHVIEGSNADDAGDYRPGSRAIRELDVKSPLLEAGLSKAVIRMLSEKAGLPTWNKPSYACLSTRFVYGERITKEKLVMVGKAEQFLINMGFIQVRVRVHGDVARIETGKDEIKRFLDPGVSESITAYFEKLGFIYVALDLNGYKTGSMNKSLNIL